MEDLLLVMQLSLEEISVDHVDDEVLEFSDRAHVERGDEIGIGERLRSAAAHSNTRGNIPWLDGLAKQQ